MRVGVMPSCQLRDRRQPAPNHSDRRKSGVANHSLTSIVGAIPNIRRHVRLRCAESANPQSCAASVHDCPAIAAPTADPIRAHRRYERNDMPTCATNRCRKRLGDRCATAAASASVSGTFSRERMNSIARATRGSTLSTGPSVPLISVTAR